MVRRGLAMFASIASSAAALSGCNSTHSKVGVSDFFSKMQSQLTKSSGNIEITNLSTPLNISDYPLMSEVCNESLATVDYKYDGDMMRVKVVKHAYELGGDTLVYRHEYAVCFGFYPPEEGARQEVAYVKFLATLKGSAGEAISRINQIQGGVVGLLSDSKFRIPLNATDSTWAEVPMKEYPDETSRVQFLKMNPLDMNAVNKYDAEKIQDLLAFEFVHANVSRLGNVLQLEDVEIAVFQNAMQ